MNEKQLAHYTLLDKLGSGGMGEVYRAEDTKLGRLVAIKVLPEDFAGDKERLARFEREAKMLASLNHPNIAAIHGLEEDAGKSFLVMELVEGDTLEQRLAKGALPVEEALEVCRQIAEAVEAAHEKGIIHRDLKPANVKITPEGRVKVLDFGLAKVLVEDQEGPVLMESPTLTAQMTQPGIILGTAPYMSPEQAKGKAVDRRTDIWAFGCILYECLTGKMAFKRDSISEVIAAILKEEPDWNVLPAYTPAGVHSLLKRCLDKDPRRRFRDAGDTIIWLEESEGEPATSFKAEPNKHKVLPFVFTAAGAALLTALLFMVFGPEGEAPKPAISRHVFNLPEGQSLISSPGLGELQEGRFPPITLSHDGIKMAFIAHPELSESEDDARSLFLWEFDKWEPELLHKDANIEMPFFSADDTYLGFLAADEILKISVDGGQPIKICSVPFEARGAAWAADGTIYLGGMNAGLQKIESDQVEVVEITRPDSDRGEQYHAWPSIFHDDGYIFFDAVTGESSNIGVLSLKTGQWRILERTGGASQPHGLDSGHLVFFRDSGLFAVPFDLAGLELAGSVTSVVDHVFMSWNAGHDLGFFAMSGNGSLVYIFDDSSPGKNRLVLVDRKGTIKELPLDRGRYGTLPSFSPDGKLLAFGLSQRASGDLWFWDLESQTTPTRLTSQHANIYPVWNNNSQDIFYSCFRKGSTSFEIFKMSLTGESSAEQVFSREFDQHPTSLSPDGRFLAYQEAHPDSGFDIHILDLVNGPESTPFMNTAYNEMQASFSPDGRYLAYVSNETNREEVFVKSVTAGGRKSSISNGGGIWPHWSADGTELFFLQGSKMMVVEVGFEPEFHIKTSPKPLFEGEYLPFYDVTADGRQFVMITKEQAVLTKINVVFNWTEELKQKVPTGK
jgi:serine/threonine-protein kinase